MASRNTRSQFTSPGQNRSPAGRAAGAIGGNGVSKKASSQGSRLLMKQWLEPDVQNKASVDEQGLQRYGVTEMMLPLGTLPKQPAKKRSQAHSNQRNSSTPNVSMSRSSSGHGKPPVRKIILHASGSGSKTKKSTDDLGTDIENSAPVSRNLISPGDDVDMFMDFPAKSMSRKSGGHKDLLVSTEDDDYQPSARKSKSGKGGHGKSTGSASAVGSATNTPADVSTPVTDAASLKAEPETPTPSLRKSSKRAAASAATLAAARSATLEAAAETMRKVVQKAESQGRHATGCALQALYNESPGDMDLLGKIDKIFNQRSRHSDSAMWAQFDRLIEERRREDGENSVENNGLNYGDSDSDMDGDNGHSILAQVIGDSDYGSGRFSGLESSAKSGRNRKAGNSRDVGVAEDGSSLAAGSASGRGGRKSVTSKKNGKTRDAEAAKTRKPPVSGSQRPQSSGSPSLGSLTHKIKLKTNRPAKSAQDEDFDVIMKTEDGDDVGNDAITVTPTPVRRIVAFSSSAQKSAKTKSDAAAAAVAASAKDAAQRSSRSMSISSDSSLSSLSSVELEEDALLSDDDDLAMHSGVGAGDDGQPMTNKDGRPTNQGPARHNNKSRGKDKDASATNTCGMRVTGSGHDFAPSESGSGHQNTASSSKTKSDSAATAPHYLHQSNSIASYFRRTVELHHQHQAKSDLADSAATSASASARASPAAGLAAQANKAEKAKFDSLDDLRQACVLETAQRTSKTESSVRGHFKLPSSLEEFGFRLRPSPPAKSPALTIASIEVDVDAVMARKKDPSPGTDSSLSTTSSVSLFHANATRSRATRGSLKRPHDGDESNVETTPPRQVTKTPPRAVTPSLHPSKKQRTGPRVKMSPKKGSNSSTAGVPRPSSKGGSEGEISQDNDDFCSACGASGELLCCDNCVKAFHFGCIDTAPDRLPDQWFCWECRVIRAPSTLPLSPTMGAFSVLGFVLERNNPKAFRLPADIQNYFEGVRAAPDGTYEDGPPPAKKPVRKTEETVDWYRLRDGDNAILCNVCHDSADNIRPIIPCSKCSLYWHLDCLDEPLTVPPHLKTWVCPLHVDDDVLAMIVSGPAHSYRKVKNAPVITPAFTRGNRNNGIIELEDDLDEYFNDFKKAQASRDSGWADPDTYGRTYRLKSSAVMNDFIDSLRVPERPATLREKKAKRILEQRRRAQIEDRSLADMSIDEVEAAFVLSTIPSSRSIPVEGPRNVLATPQLKQSKLSSTRIPASPALTQSPKTEPETDPGLLSGTTSPQRLTGHDLSKEAEVMSLISRLSGTSITPGAPLTDSTRQSLRSAMAHIQLLLSDEAPTPPLDATKSYPSSPLQMTLQNEHKIGNQIGDTDTDTDADAVMIDLPNSELTVEGDKNEPKTVSPEVEEGRVESEKGREKEKGRQRVVIVGQEL